MNVQNFNSEIGMIFHHNSSILDSGGSLMVEIHGAHGHHEFEVGLAMLVLCLIYNHDCETVMETTWCRHDTSDGSGCHAN